MSDIEIEIDGKKLTAKPNEMVIQVADRAGIYIPRFCYHKHLSIAANCRMCLVEVEKAPKALPACATPVMPGMKVFTRSEKTIEAQRAVMEFLLINHPLDCPVCDQGGECELQDMSMGYGSSHSHYDECKRSVEDKNLGPLVATEMTRCIHCTRCVRFGDEIAGMRELGVTYRGEHAEIGTYVEEAITSEVSGNIIDLCPVGALTSKPYQFTARAWEMRQSPSISPHDCIGSNLNVHTLDGKVMRVVARENQAVNETWLSDRDRFSYTSLYHPERVKEPMIREDGKWVTVSWQRAMETVVKYLQSMVHEQGADKLGALVSPSSTVEEMYLLQKIMRGLGSPHIDHRLREIDTSDQAEFGAYPGFEMDLTALEKADAILLLGSNLQKEQPLAALRVRKAIANGATLATVNFVDYQFNFKVDAKHIVAPHAFVHELNRLVNAFETNTDHPIASLLRGKERVCVMVGTQALHHTEAASIRWLASKVATLTGGKLNLMTDGSNAAGAWLAGAVPHRLPAGKPATQVGLSVSEMLTKPRKLYVLLNVEPELDGANAAVFVDALKQAKQIIALSLYRNPVLEQHADVILPVAPFTETAGTYVNAMGEWQSFTGMAAPFGHSRPAWKILRVLGTLLQLDGFDYADAAQVKHELHADVLAMQPRHMHFKAKAVGDRRATLSRVGEIPIYAIDHLTRRAEPLQQTQALMLGELAVVRLHHETAKALNLAAGQEVTVQQQGAQVRLPLVIDERLPRGAAYVPGAIAATAMLGDLFGDIDINV